MPTVQEILTETPRPTFDLRPGYQAPLPQGVTLSRPTAGRTLDPASGLYESVPSGKRRVFGSQQGLLMESPQRTNYVRHSSDVSTGWNTVSSRIVGTQPSVIDNEIAHIHEGGDNIDRAVQNSAGVFTGGLETAWFIGELIEDQSQGSKIDLAVIDSPSKDYVAQANYDFSSGKITNTGADLVQANARETRINGNAAVLLAVVYNPSVSGYGGNGRTLYLRPAKDNTKTQVAWHHAQIEAAINASSPIVTGSSGETRSGDDMTIFSGGQPSWWNPNQGTLFMETSLRFFRKKQSMRLLQGGSPSEGYIGVAKSPIRIFSTDTDNNVISSPVESFSKLRIAVSFDESDIRLAVNGDVRTAGSHNGSFLMPNQLKIGSENTLLATISELRYNPGVLSESTLETLVS